jgi:hypothetical protein
MAPGQVFFDQALIYTHTLRRGLPYCLIFTPITPKVKTEMTRVAAVLRSRARYTAMIPALPAPNGSFLGPHFFGTRLPVSLLKK